MYNECRHIFTSGRKCQSPALKNQNKDQNFCYFHSNTRKRPTPANQPYNPYTEPKEAAIALTPLEDADAIQLAISDVVLRPGSEPHRLAPRPDPHLRTPGRVPEQPPPRCHRSHRRGKTSSLP